MLPLESVPNFSEGRDAATIEAIGSALSEGVRLLDVHSDPDHNRSVFTVVGEDGPLVAALVGAVEVTVIFAPRTRWRRVTGRTAEPTCASSSGHRTSPAKSLPSLSRTPRIAG